MKATFEDFLNENPMYQGLSDNRDARHVFDILNEDDSISDAIKMTESDEPALLANVDKIEDYIYNLGEEATFDLNDNFNRRGVGRMQKTILAPFGYTPIPKSQKTFSARYFRSASCYELTN